jgi:hypothetical protein
MHEFALVHAVFLFRGCGIAGSGNTLINVAVNFIFDPTNGNSVRCQWHRRREKPLADQVVKLGFAKGDYLKDTLAAQ